MRVKEESGNPGLKRNIQNTKMTASSPSTSWQTDGETHGNSDRLFSRAPQSLQTVAAAMKLRLLLLGRTALTNRDTVLKRRDITLPTKFPVIKAMVFLVVMYRCESWSIKKAENQRTDAFKLWCWRRLLKVSWISL